MTTVRSPPNRHKAPMMFSLLFIAFGFVTVVQSWVLATAALLRLLEIHSVFDRLLPDMKWWFLLLLAGGLYVLGDATQKLVIAVLKGRIWSFDGGETKIRTTVKRGYSVK